MAKKVFKGAGNRSVWGSVLNCQPYHPAKIPERERRNSPRPVAAILLIWASGVVACSSPSEEIGAVGRELGRAGHRPRTTKVTPPIDETGLCDSASRGEAAFRDGVLRGLQGNGRACSDCHMPSDSFQLSPASAEARFQAMTSSGNDDPLFRAMDADDFPTHGASASDFGNLRQSGLIRIRMPLPANIKLVDPASCTTAGVPAPCQTAETYAVSTETVADIWRAVPSVLNVSISGPDGRDPTWPRGPDTQGGYQLDARIDTLPNQALAAFINHAAVQVPPGGQMLDDLAAYESTLVTEAEPPLDDLETAGKAVFERACAVCHDGPAMSTPLAQMGRYHDVSTTCPAPVDTVSPPRWSLPACPPALTRNARTYEISFSDGFKQRRTTTDPGRALLTGFVFSASAPPAGGTCLHLPCGSSAADDWQKLDVAPLHGIGKTAPYFHNNSAATLEDVVIHYEEFYKRASASIPPPALPFFLSTDGIHRDRPNLPFERAALVAYLKRL